VAVAVPARAGAVDGTTDNSDVFIWRKFTEFVAPVTRGQKSPVIFETWASDDDTFSTAPHWPDPSEPRKLHASVLALTKRLPASPLPGSPVHSITSLLSAPIDVPCATPGNAGVGAFPTGGTPSPCIAEETKRNRVQFDYIKDNQLNTKAGLAAAFAKSFTV